MLKTEKFITSLLKNRGIFDLHRKGRFFENYLFNVYQKTWHNHKFSIKELFEAYDDLKYKKFKHFKKSKCFKIFQKLFTAYFLLISEQKQKINTTQTQ